MLKICIVNPFEHGGGAEYQIGLLIDALIASNRYEVHYLTHLSIRATERAATPFPGWVMAAPCRGSGI